MAFWRGNAWEQPREDQQQHAGTPPISSFAEIMSETLAEQLQEEELSDFDDIQAALEASLKDLDDEPDCSRDLQMALMLSEDPDCSADKMMALELQNEFDREEELKEQFSKDSESGVIKAVLTSVRHSYEKYVEEGEEDSFDEDECRELATEMYYQYQKERFPPCGFVRNNNGEIITKHDKGISDRKNCQRLFQSTSDLKSGDIIGEKIATKIVNELEAFGAKELKRKARVKDKDEKAVTDAAVDGNARIIMLKWINRGMLDRVEGIIAIGKESTVIQATLDESEEDGTPKNFAIKVYKQALNAFRNRAEYVKDDYRFKNTQGIMKLWAEKEYMNLQRLTRAEMPCPTPVQLKKNVLLMTLIEMNGKPAPCLKNIAWEDESAVLDAFEQVKKIVIRMFVDCKLVHGDLSEYNLLYSNNVAYVIDVAQAVDVSHPRALEFLVRDIENILTFFAKLGAESLPTAQAVFTEVTKLDMDASKPLLPQVEAFEHENRHLNMRLFKANPSDCELSRMYSDHASTSKE